MAEAPLILGILGSTRQGRRGEKVANWFGEIASAREDIDYEPVDLRDWDLGFFDEPKVPSQGDYENEGQRRWAEKVGAADGFVWISPEYNHGYPPPLKNAIDFIYAEWNRKPMAVVSYGGAAGGLRAAEQLRLVAIEVQMAPVRSSVFIPRAYSSFDEEGRLTADTEYREGQAAGLLDELAWWANVLREARAAG
jgi:NAD(P)H-dependent FMN reductase